MTLKKTISILGSTGSIGSNTIDVINSNKNKFSVLSLTSKNNVNLLSKQWFRSSDSSVNYISTFLKV